MQEKDRQRALWQARGLLRKGNLSPEVREALEHFLTVYPSLPRREDAPAEHAMPGENGQEKA